MSWHAPADVLERYAVEPERMDETTAASVEAHLLVCDLCRAIVREGSDPAVESASWAGIADVVDRPSRSLVERALHRLGLSAATARLVAATRPLRGAWAVAVIGISAIAVVSARTADSPGPFLALAPVVPLLTVALAFAPIADPAGEAGVACPLSGAGLMLRRLVSVMVPAIVVVAAGAIFVPESGRSSVIWLLPGLALATGALALTTYVRATTAVAMMGGAWWCGVALVAAPRLHPTITDSVLFGPTGQVIALGVSVLFSLVAVRRRNRFATLEVTW